jgi:selenocysteine-specific translation elongation factor
MPNLTVAVLAPQGYAKDLGKAGTTSDITFYNIKKGTTTVTFVEPTRYPEKLSSLFFAVSLADTVMFVVDAVDARFGECVLMLQCAGRAKGRLILRNFISSDQIAPKNIEDSDLDRGYVLSNDPALRCSGSITAKAALVKYWPAPLTEGMVLCIGHWMQFLPCRVENVEPGSDWRMPTLTLKLDKKLVYPPNARAVLHYLEGGKLRVAGTLKLP